MLMPRLKTPNLNIQTVADENFELSSEISERGTLICFYRGLHCPICATYLKELEKLTPQFQERGINTIAVSTDNEERANEMAARISATNLRVGYGFSLSEARDWGLYISTSRGKTSIGIEEPELFAEPGLFIVTPEQTLYYSSVQTMPFVRPNFSELLKAVDFMIEKNYPARGEYSGEL